MYQVLIALGVYFTKVPLPKITYPSNLYRGINK